MDFKTFALGLWIVLFSEVSISGCKPNLEGIMEFREHQKIEWKINLNREKREDMMERVDGYIKNMSDKINEKDALLFALDYVADSLTFRWDYFFGEKGTDYFVYSAKGEHKGDCIDYSFLFERTFNYMARRAGLNMKAEIKRSKGYIFGKFIDTHDWVMIKEGKGGKRYFIDPTFYDYGFSYDIRGLVK